MSDIVYVDDEREEFLSLASGEQRQRFVEVDYEAEDSDQPIVPAARIALVWLFDFFLVAPAETDGADENGFSLFQKWNAAIVTRPITVVVSNDLQKALGKPLGPEARNHIIAQRHGVEWIGGKTEQTLARVVELADAAATVMSALTSAQSDPLERVAYDVGKLCFDVLKAPPDAEWANNAQRQVDRARPPREVPMPVGPATARPIVGWLLTHVLPYPSFLLSDAQAAVRLGISPKSFRAIIETVQSAKSDTPHALLLSAGLYVGPLAGFLGRRWWRAAIDELAWALSQSEARARSAMETLAGQATPEWLEQEEPVLLSDADLVETDEVAEARDCVRVTDEDFPANVEPAWVRVDSARKDRLLAARVVYEDRELLSAAE